MSSSLRFLDPATVSDLRTLLSRAARVDDTAVRLVARGGVLAVYVAAFWPRGLLDRGFTVLGLRTMPVEEGEPVDRVVPLRGVLDRLAANAGGTAGPVDLVLPDQEVATVWAGISPPRSGWLPVGTISASRLADAARNGAAEVASSVPTNAGDHIVHSVRQAVWTRSIVDRDDIPAGAAFAADALGFLGDPGEDVPVYVNGPWLRLSPHRGHVLARRGVV